MTQIEDLVRQALAETSTLSTATDPLAALDRRVRRARRWVAAGAGGVAAAVAAAVVVPLAVLGGGSDSPNSVRIATPATPTPSATASALAASGVQVLRSSGSYAVSAASGQQPWVLYNDKGNADDNYIAQVSPDGQVSHDIPVGGPADYVVAGDQMVWVVGSNDDGSEALVTGVDPAFSPPVGEVVLHQQVFTYAAAAGDSLYVVADKDTGNVVERFRTTRNQSFELASTTPAPGAEEIVATDNGHLWVHEKSRLVELIPAADGSVRTGASVEWGAGQIYSSSHSDSAPDGVWAYDGRVIGLDPPLLQQGASLAEGYRIGVAGRPSTVVSDKVGGVYVAVTGLTGDGSQGQRDLGISYYSPKALQDGNTPVTASLPGVQVTTMSVDPAGGVDFVDDSGVLARWDPTATTATATATSSPAAR